MRIGIDICDLSSGIVGVGSVILNQIRNLALIDSDNDFFLYQSDDKEYVPARNFITRKAYLPTYSYKREQLFFSARTFLDRLDVFHAPIHLPPKYIPKKTKVVMTVHDLHAEKDQDGLYPIAMREYFIPKRVRAIEKADAVIVHTEKVKNDVMEHCDISSDKIHVFPLGIKEEFRTEYAHDDLLSVKKKYKLPDKYILYVGSIESWKRPSFLIEAFNKYKKANDSDVQLVLVGRRGSSKKECAAVESAAKENSDIHWYEKVDDSDLPLFYRNAEMFVSASVREGVGMIFLEAMASGIPVVGSNTSAIPETIGEAGLLFEKDSTEDLVDKIRDVLHDVSLRNDLIKKGLERAELFSWKKYAESILGLYKSLCS